jgi:hypothetical protein
MAFLRKTSELFPNLKQRKILVFGKLEGLAKLFKFITHLVSYEEWMCSDIFRIVCANVTDERLLAPAGNAITTLQLSSQ